MIRLPTISDAPPSSVRLADREGRSVGYLRLSLTRACQMRCLYCRPAHITAGSNRSDLTPDEIEQLVREMVGRYGVHKVRITGGDPTARKDLLEIIERLGRIDGLDDLAMTTNGLTLASQAGAYVAAGLKRVNVSLDSLDAQRFHQITGVDGLDRVLQGITAAMAANLSPVKINTVVVRGVNDTDLPSLVEFAAERGVTIRFIELMPMGPLADRWGERYVTESEMRQQLEGHVTGWRPLPQGSDAARRYEVTIATGRTVVVGFITAMSCNFCSACNRIRIAADGSVYPCLMDEPAGSVLPAIRPHFDSLRLRRLLDDAFAGKRQTHPATGFVTMTHIGG